VSQCRSASETEEACYAFCSQSSHPSAQQDGILVRVGAGRGCRRRLRIVVRETSQTASPMPANTTAAGKRDNETTKRELEGKAGDRDVNITIEQDGSTTKVEVTAKTSPVTWDKDFAKSVLEEILEKTKG
jgi:hypothetical protein